MNHIILIGFMGAGKSSAGRLLAEEGRLSFVDTDELIEARERTSISRIFAKRGEPYFRDLETETLKELKKETRRLVIAVGGGLPMREENRRLLKELGTVVYLQADVDTLAARLDGDTTRPKLQGGPLREKIETLMRAREETYLQTAQKVLNTTGKSLIQTVKEMERDVL